MAGMSKTSLGTALAALLYMTFVPGAVGQTLNLRYGQAYSAARSIFSLPVAIAEREGFFAREGLNVQILQPIPGGADHQIAALHNDSVDLTHVATPFLIRAALDGLRCGRGRGRIQQSDLQRDRQAAKSRPLPTSRASCSDWRTNTAPSRCPYASSWPCTASRAASSAFAPIEGTSGRWACLRRGDCDAVVLGQPQDLIAMEQGFRMLGASTEAVPELLYTVTAVRRSWAEANKDAMVRYVRGLGCRVQVHPRSRPPRPCCRTVMQSTNASEAIARQTLALFFEPERGVLPKQAEINLEGLAQVIAMMGEAGADQGAVAVARAVRGSAISACGGGGVGPTFQDRRRSGGSELVERCRKSAGQGHHGQQIRQIRRHSSAWRGCGSQSSPPPPTP